MNESVDATRCSGQGNCQEGEKCLTHHLWLDLSQQIHEFLSDISLADLVSRREVQSVAERQQQSQIIPVDQDKGAKEASNLENRNQDAQPSPMLNAHELLRAVSR